MTDMARWFRDHEWATQVVTAQPYYPDFERYIGYGRNRRYDVFEGIPIYRLPTMVPSGGRALRRAITDSNFLLQGCITAYRARIPDARHVVSVSPGSPLAVSVGAAFARRSGAHHTAIVHDVMTGLASGLGMVSSPLLTHTMETLERRALNSADAVRTLTSQMTETVKTMGVHGPVSELPLWATVARPSRRIPRDHDLQFSGNLGRKQALHQLVHVAQALGHRRPNTVMLVRGAGTAKADVEAMAADTDAHILFAPPVPHHRLAEALASAPIHLVSQEREAARHVMPSKIINAMAAGGIIVAISPPGSPVSDLAQRCESVFAFPEDRLTDLVDKIVALLGAECLATLSRASIDYVRAHHDREAILGSFESGLVGDA